MFLKRGYSNKFKYFLISYIIFLILFLSGEVFKRYKHLEIVHSLEGKGELDKLKDTNRNILKVLIGKHKDVIMILILMLPCLISMRFYIKNIEDEGVKDSLTGLYLRRKIETVIPTIKTTPKLSWTMLYIDLDGLKKINDIKGHKAGDKYILDFTRLVNSVIRKSDFFLRVGGDEFIILLKDVEEESRFRIIQRFYNIRGKNHIEFSIGVVFFKGNKNFKKADMESLIHKADKRMYKDKYFRKNQNHE